MTDVTEVDVLLGNPELDDRITDIVDVVVDAEVEVGKGKVSYTVVVVVVLVRNVVVVLL